MVFGLKITQEHEGTAQTMPKRVVNQGLSQANGYSAKYWRDRILIKAFGAQAASRRGYKKRSPDYIKRKKAAAKRGKARYGGNRALVFEGLLEDAIVGPKHMITSNKNKSVVRMVGPAYFRGQIAAEITTIIPNDMKRLDNVANERFGKFLDKNKHRKKIKI